MPRVNLGAYLVEVVRFVCVNRECPGSPRCLFTGAVGRQERGLGKVELVLISLVIVPECLNTTVATTQAFAFPHRGASRAAAGLGKMAR